MCTTRHLVKMHVYEVSLNYLGRIRKKNVYRWTDWDYKYVRLLTDLYEINTWSLSGLQFWTVKCKGACWTDRQTLCKAAFGFLGKSNCHWFECFSEFMFHRKDMSNCLAFFLTLMPTLTFQNGAFFPEDLLSWCNNAGTGVTNNIRDSSLQFWFHDNNNSYRAFADNGLCKTFIKQTLLIKFSVFLFVFFHVHYI